MEEDVIESYLNQLAKKMRQDSVGFIHHSNMGSYKNYFSLINRIKNNKIKNGLIKLGIIEPNEHWRALSVTAGNFRRSAEKAGLQCVSQEIINWGTKRLTDCISVFTKKEFHKYNKCKILKNRDFMKEAKRIRYLSELYGEKH